MILCEKNNSTLERIDVATKVEANLETLFKCSQEIYILKYYICDGYPDCEGFPDDEMNCACTLKESIVSNSLFCYKSCFQGICSCSELFRKMLDGGCMQYTQHSEWLIETKIDMKFNCSDSSQISFSFVDDLIPDCKNGEDEPLLYDFNNQDRLTFKCSDTNMLKCYQGHIRCYSKEQQCQYSLNSQSNTLAYCRNGQHLSNCTEVLCGSRVKCPANYCIPQRYICDGKWDCWNGFDEQACEKRSCFGLFSYRNSSVCIHIKDVCDDNKDCPYGDDEVQCDVTLCVLGCTCLSKAMMCQNVSLTHKQLVIFICQHFHQ